jgi:regulation of enolase protein 1 (concanavalin A-like superfamily)
VEAITLEAVPFALGWLLPPAAWSQANGALTIDAGPQTDWFIDPAGSATPILSAPALMGRIAGDFVFSARVEVDFASTFDAGVLVVHAGELAWAKLCFERSPDAEPTIVSVVTRGVSDDCNSVVVDGNSVWLRISRLGSAFAFHASTDSSRWRLVRHFALAAAETLAVGFLAQSPLGDGCRARFDAISFDARRLGDLRNGL